jgi:hypothetical protein
LLTNFSHIYNHPVIQIIDVEVAKGAPIIADENPVR